MSNAAALSEFRVTALRMMNAHVSKTAPQGAGPIQAAHFASLWHTTWKNEVPLLSRKEAADLAKAVAALEGYQP